MANHLTPEDLSQELGSDREQGLAPHRDDGACPGLLGVRGIGQDAVPERNMAIRFTGGQIIGSGPCNSFTATNAATLPAIQVTNFVPTAAPCGDSAAEQRFFNAVRTATSADYQGGVLLVKGATYMQFEPGRPL